MICDATAPTWRRCNVCSIPSSKNSDSVNHLDISDCNQLYRKMVIMSLRWRHNGRNGVSNHQPHDCLLNRLFMRRSKKTSKLRVTGPCEDNSPVTGEFPSQTASKTENISIWWRHHVRMDLRWRKIEAATFHAPRLFHYGVLTHWGLEKIF